MNFNPNLQLQEQPYHFRKVETNSGKMLHYLERGLHYLKTKWSVMGRPVHSILFPAICKGPVTHVQETCGPGSDVVCLFHRFL